MRAPNVLWAFCHVHEGFGALVELLSPIESPGDGARLCQTTFRPSRDVALPPFTPSMPGCPFLHLVTLLFALTLDGTEHLVESRYHPNGYFATLLGRDCQFGYAHGHDGCRHLCLVLPRRHELETSVHTWKPTTWSEHEVTSTVKGGMPEAFRSVPFLPPTAVSRPVLSSAQCEGTQLPSEKQASRRCVLCTSPRQLCEFSSGQTPL